MTASRAGAEPPSSTGGAALFCLWLSLAATLTPALLAGGRAGSPGGGHGPADSGCEGEGARPLDVVELTDGRRVAGRVVLHAPDRVVLRADGEDLVFESGEIRSLDSLRDRLAAGLVLLDSLPYGSIGLHLDAAEALAELGLCLEARLLYWRVLAFDPEVAGAHRGLGSKRSGGRWLVPRDPRPVPFDQARARAADWGSAWELETTHYVVRSNLPLESSVDCALDLERIYHGVYGLFGDDLELYEVTRPMEVWIHADRTSFPELSGHLAGYFAQEGNRLYIDASQGVDRGLLAHEATHQLLYNTALASRRADGRLPGWLDEGLAQYVQASTTPVGAGLELRAGAEVDGWLDRHAQATHPESLRTILNLAASDFRAGESGLRYAQSWSLVQFLLHADDGAHRERFFDFVRSAFRGQSSPSHFDDAYAGRSAQLEEEWSAWVRLRAGN